QNIEQWDYPKAGDANPLARLGVARIGGGVTWADTSKYAANDLLIVRVGWTPDGKRVAYETQNRTQNWLDLNVADAASGAATTLVHETTRFWINSEDTVPPLWLKDGSFLWLSDRSGWTHAYHYKS